MKKSIKFFGFLFLLSSVTLNAQSDFKFGFQASPTFSWMSSSDNKINSNGTNLGMKFGLVAEYYFAQNYGVTTGAVFAFNQGGTLLHDLGGDLWKESKLSNTDFHDLPAGVKLKYNLQYIEIPMGFKMRTGEFGYLRYFAELPILTLGILTQARGNIEGNGRVAEKEDIKKDVTPINLAIGFGGGVEYTINENTSLVGGIYYQNGFIDMTSNKATKIDADLNESAEDSKGVAKNITIRVGVIF